MHTQVLHFVNATRKAMTQAVKNSHYDPNHLLNALIAHLGLSNDGALSRKLKVATDVISNIRDGRLQVCGSMLMWMHEATGISIEELRRLMGDRRAKCRLSYSIQSRTRTALACSKLASLPTRRSTLVAAP